MDKKILYLILFGFLLFSVNIVFAVQSYGPSYDIKTIMDNIKNIAWVIFAFIVVICFVAAGVLFLTAQGQVEKIQTAKAAFLWGLAGVVVGIIAYSIITIVSSIIGG